MRKISILVLAAIFGFSALASAGPWQSFIQQFKDKNKAQKTEQKEENKGSRETLKGMKPEQKTAAIIDHKATQQTENKEASQALRKERIDLLKQKLADNEKMAENKAQTTKQIPNSNAE